MLRSVLRDNGVPAQETTRREMKRNARLPQSSPVFLKSATFALAILAAPFATAHHSIAVTFNLDEIVEIEGEITRILWRNPHVRFNVRTRDEDGRASDWWMEGGAVSRLVRWGVEEGAVSTGDMVRLAGFPSRRRAHDSTDPATYIEPLTLTKHYLWVPGLEVRPYECTEE